MNKTLIEILASRYDVSNYLFHFTSGGKAKSTLDSILSDKKLKDIYQKRVICFTEAPLPALVEMFELFEKYKDPMYAPYGVAIPKNDLFALGARPVIYGPDDEIKYIHPAIRWRYQQYDPTFGDYSWMREWRLPEREFSLDNNRDFIITKCSNEELDHSLEEGDIEIDGCIEDGRFVPDYYMNYKRVWKSISIETIKVFSLQRGSEIDEKLGKQKIGDEESYYLGS